jgi:hypothetical protein
MLAKFHDTVDQKPIFRVHVWIWGVVMLRGDVGTECNLHVMLHGRSRLFGSYSQCRLAEKDSPTIYASIILNYLL